MEKLQTKCGGATISRPFSITFFKKQRGLELVSLVFCMTFEEKGFSFYILLTDKF